MSIFQNIRDSLSNSIGGVLQSRIPFINEPVVFSHRVPRQPVDFKALFNWYKSNPELHACVDAIVEDVLSDGYYIEGTRNKKLSAEKFLEQNKAKQAFKTYLTDTLVTGNGYLYKIKFNSREDLEKAVTKSIISNPRIGTEFKSKAIEYKMKEALSDENIFKTRNFITVASSTISISHDEHGNIKGYLQRVQGLPKATFLPDEIIHFAPKIVDGNMYGFSDVRTLIQEMSIISNIKDYASYSFDKNTTPNILYILKNERPGSQTYKQLRDSIRKFESDKNRFKSMILCTGQEGVQIERINELKKDMEFRELKRDMTQVIVSVFGIPATRLPGIVAEKGIKGAPSEEGYWGKISHLQDMFEELINSQLLNEFDVKLRFNRTYKVNEIKEAQTEMFKLDTIFKLNTLLSSHDKMLSLDMIMNKMGLKETELTEFKESPMQMKMEGNRQDFQTDKKNSEEGTDKEKPDNARKEKQKENASVKK